MNKITTVTLRSQRIGPRKARLVIDLVRGMDASEAQNVLARLNKKGSELVLKLLGSAIDAAKSKDYKAEELYICESVCQEGRRLKRFTVKARGRSTQFKKRMSHLKISLAKKEEKNKDEKTRSESKGAKRKQKGNVAVKKVVDNKKEE